MKKKRAIGGVIVLVLLAVILVGAFVLVMRLAPRSAEDTTEVSETDTLLNIDVSGNYPSTPREVMKLYNRYIECLYGASSDGMTDAQIQALGAKMRELYDTELLDENPQEMNFDKLVQELDNFRQSGLTIIQANVCSSNEVKYVDVKGGDGAFVEVSYFMKGNASADPQFTRTYQQFLLRRDSDGNWKILGFKKVDKPAEEVE